ncbi:sulfatase [Polaribacter aestuariivivens]|uniref:Sulfatase n=1 Tax=Polaribacter aestuariivivens TaxID=2304626 RepID=A0A5S3N5P6_9FLAO|nr:sulfatase [Polaribacter aestuariivivens]TMM30620.1 sulfatase [Polaribacter aestuariivivens]
MKKILFILFFCTTTLTINAQKESPPNVVFILADDLGWSDVTLYGKTKLYETPNLERLAARGITYTRAYAASPLCSPTRASILTGQTPARTGITAPTAHLGKVKLKASLNTGTGPANKSVILESVTRLDNKLPTLGKQFKNAGYQTAHFGKWHLGTDPYSPLQHGFNVDIPHFAGPGPAGSFVAPWKYKNFKEKYAKEHIEDRMADEAVSWLRNIDKTKPFFMNYWQFSVHAPFDAKETLKKYYRTKVDLSDEQHSVTYAAMVHSMDDAIGRLLDELDRLGLSKNTIIVFTSDNGGNMYNGVTDVLPNGEKYFAPPTSNRPLRGGKATMFEGGVRVPTIISYPGITPPGTTNDALIQSTDFYPTLLSLAGLKMPKNHPVDGIDITETLKGKDIKRDGIYTYFPHQPGVPDWLPTSISVHSDDWKLIRLFHQGNNFKHDYLLYNLKWDISEHNNLAKTYPKKVAELDKLIEKHLKDTKAIVPIPNPKFDPTRYKPENIGKQNGGLKGKKLEIN